MDSERIPTLGYFQPNNEIYATVSLCGMGERKQGKRGPRPASKDATRLKRILIKNTQIVIDQNFPLKNYRTKSEQQKHAASEGDVTWSTIQRVLDPRKGLTLDVLADVAAGLGVQPFQLLDPKFGGAAKGNSAGAADDAQGRRGRYGNGQGRASATDRLTRCYPVFQST